MGSGFTWLGLRVDRFIRASDFFTIENVEIFEASEVVQGEIRQIVSNLKAGGEDNLLLMRKGQWRMRIEALPRVRSALLRRHFPGTLQIKIEERKPLVAANAGGLFWIDRDGVLLAKAGVSEIAKAGVPVLTGLRGPSLTPGVQVRQPMLKETLGTIRFLREREPELGARFAEWHLNSSDEVVGVLRKGLEVRFGQGDPAEKLALLATLLDEVDALEDSRYLDLRFDAQAVYY